MRIQITASRRDDILRERDQYNEEMKKQNAVHDQQYAKYEFAKDYNLAQIENTIRSLVPGLSELDVRVDVDTYYLGGVRIRFSKEGRDSLRWSWDVSLDRDGNIRKESSSWSNMEVTTPEQVDDLKKSVDIISTLVSMDWKPILESGLAGKPKYDDYVAVKELRSRDDEFDRQLKVAAIEEIIGQPMWIKGRVMEDSRWSYGDRWYMIHSQTDKFYNISTIATYTVDNLKTSIEEGKEGYSQEQLDAQIKNNSEYTERVKKEKFISKIYDQIETMDMHGNVTVQNESAEANTNTDSNLITV